MTRIKEIEHEMEALKHLEKASNYGIPALMLATGMIFGLDLASMGLGFLLVMTGSALFKAHRCRKAAKEEAESGGE